MPRQMPRMGALRTMTASSSAATIPLALSRSIAEPKCPTPGRMSLVAPAITSGSDDTWTSPPALRQMLTTEPTLPAS